LPLVEKEGRWKQKTGDRSHDASICWRLKMKTKELRKGGKDEDKKGVA
jgi:hypothetical protein